MVWLRLCWWVVWRGVVSGAILGVALGMVISIPYAFAAALSACGYGLFIGAAIGGVLGLLLGVLDGGLLTIMTWLFFNPPHDARQFLRAVRGIVVLANPVAGFIIIAAVMNIIHIILIVPVCLATIAALYLSRGFAEYAERELVSARKSFISEVTAT